MKSRDPDVNLYSFKEAIKQLRRVCLSKAKSILLEYQAIKDLSQVIKVTFRLSKILIQVANGSTGLMRVITPCYIYNG